MSQIHNNELSVTLMNLTGDFLGHTAGWSMTSGEVRAIVLELTLMQKLAVSMEQELACFRVGEAGKSMSDFLHQEATKQLDALIRDPDGKVISPNFGRKP
ncbi:hypothetical protein [Rhizobium herbae]